MAMAMAMAAGIVLVLGTEREEDWGVLAGGTDEKEKEE